MILVTKSTERYLKIDYAYTIMYLNVYKANMGIIFSLNQSHN